MCEQSGIHTYTHEGVTKEFNVHLTEQDAMYDICGMTRTGSGIDARTVPANACILNNHDIYVTPGRTCPKSMAHELSHGFGMDFVDA